MGDANFHIPGLESNAYGRLYRRGCEYTTVQKLEFEETYWMLRVQSGGSPPGQRQFAREIKVGQKYAKKLMAEIEDKGAVQSVEILKEERWEHKQKGVGSQCLTTIDTQVLLHLRHTNPARSNKSYVANLFRLTRTIVSSSFISTFFDKEGPYRGNFRVMNKVPVDKYKASNIVTYADYLNYISYVPPWKIKFGDEKSVKGEEVFNFTGRIDPVTGEKPQLVVPSDFRNTYCVMGMITVDRTCWPPLIFTMGEENHDAAAFTSFVVAAVGSGWIRRGDFIVIDNARVHSGASANILPDFLWNAPGLDGQPLNVIFVPYPIRAPESNPMELCWNIYVERSVNVNANCFVVGK